MARDKEAELKEPSKINGISPLYRMINGKVTDEILPAGDTTPGIYWNKLLEIQVEYR